MRKPIAKFFNQHVEPRFYGALWFLALGLVALMSTLGWLDTTAYKGEILFLAGLLTITMATIGWIWNGRNTLAMAKRTNALTFLARLAGKDVDDIKMVVYPYIEKYDQFKRADCGTVARPPMPEKEIQQLLGIYEQLAIAVICGAVDERMLWSSQALVSKRIYRGLYHHIENMQEKDAGYFAEFEKLVCKWHPELEKRGARMENPGHLFNPTQGVDL